MNTQKGQGVPTLTQRQKARTAQQSKTTKFPENLQKEMPLGKLVEAFYPFTPETEVLFMMGDKKFKAVAVFDNRDWGNDNEAAIIELEEIKPAEVTP